MDEASWFRMQSIGTVHREDGTDPDQYLDPAAPSVIRIDPRWEGGLAGIEGFSHLIVIFHLDRAEPRLESGEPMHPEGCTDLPAVGFFGVRPQPCPP